MQIKNHEDYNKRLFHKFGSLNINTLSKIKKNRVRINLGEDLEDEFRVQHGLKRCNAVLDFCFKGKEIWLQIILWDNDGLTALKDVGINIYEADKIFEWKEDEYNIICLYYKKYSFQELMPLTLSILNYDLAFTPSANITCYFIDLEEPVIVNIYDDRGCDIYSPNSEFLKAYCNKFSNWVNK